MNETIEIWHQRARPTPTEADFAVQVGCHVEEFIEMLETLEFFVDGQTADTARALQQLHSLLTELSTGLKQGAIRLNIRQRQQFLDSLADQVVTAIGCGHCAGMKTAEAIVRVNTSNWSKFNEEGHPVRDANGKIAKGDRYQPPNLEGLY